MTRIDYRKEIKKYGVIDNQSCMRLIKLVIDEDREACETLIMSGLKYAQYVARSYEKKIPLRKKGLQLFDLMQEGILGLIRGIESYKDKNEVYSYSTIVVTWIKQRISLAYRSSNVIRIPDHYISFVSSARKLKDEIFKSEGRRIDDSEIIENLSSSVRRCSGIYLDKVLLAHYYTNNIESLEELLTNEIDNETKDNISSEVSHIDMELDVAEIMGRCLNSKELEIIKRRFGINGYKEETLEEVGKKFGYSKQRVKQLEERALGKLRRAFIGDGWEEEC